jgi:GT2 family glycosyltransferase
MASVMVLNWNGERYLLDCFESLRPDACEHVELVLVDNGSTDGSVATVEKTFPEVRVIRNGENLGFSRGYNRAVGFARGAFLVLLNNDIVAKPGWLGPLIDTLIENPDVGLTTGKLIFQGTQKVNAAGGLLKLWTGGRELGYGQDESAFDGRRVIEPFYACGALMAIRRQLWDQLGGFDPSFFAYGEDFDLSWRARLGGYRIRFVPRAMVFHQHSGTWGVFNPDKFRMVTRHHIEVYVKCLSFRRLVHALPAYAAFAVVKAMALAVIAREPRYVATVILSFLDVARGINSLLHRRRETQRLRRVSERVALRSENYGLVTWPWEWLRVLEAAGTLGHQVSSSDRQLVPNVVISKKAGTK